MPTIDIELKGGQFTAFVFALESRDYVALSASLKGKVAQAPNFLSHASVIADIKGDEAVDVAALTEAVEAAELHLLGITGGNKEQQQAIKNAGLAVINRMQRSAEQPASAQAPLPPVVTKTKVVRNHVRSGQQIYAKDTNLVIIGAVSPGAEVIADGSIHVYGHLRGRAIAGASGNTDAAIYAQAMEPELVSIAGHYWLSDALQDRGWHSALSITLVDDALVASPL